MTANLANGWDSSTAESTVAKEAAAAVLKLPAAQGNKALPSLISYLAFEAPMIDALPFMFLRRNPDKSAHDTDVLARAKRLAVAGRILVARIRWLDEMLDYKEPLGTPEDVHRLSAAVYKEALDYFAACLVETDEMACFFKLLADLEACYATSLAIDAASCRVPGVAWTSVRVNLESYAAQARARAILASAPVEAQMIVMKASKEEQQRVRECLRSLTVAWQLYDDVLDLEEDYRDGRLSWIISETLRNLHGYNYSFGTDAFYEAALLGGYVHNALRQCQAFYRKAECAADGMFPEVGNFARSEIRKTTELIADLTGIVSSASQDEAASS